jgi:hypothetical protein
VTGADALEVLLDIEQLPGIACAGAPDVNCNLLLDVGDVLLILGYLSGRPTHLENCADVGGPV